MIPVILQTEPSDFNIEVRKKGHDWLQSQGIALGSAPPDPSKLPAYWQHSNKGLWDKYGGVCAYLAIFFEWSTGASSTDHFVAKSRSAGDAYEWNNFRLSCLGANRNKNKFDDILDPIGLAIGTFHLNLLTGKIYSNASLGTQVKQQAEKTIERLKLDSKDNRDMRVRHYGEYLRHRDKDFFQEKSPFVWYEAKRQGLL
jgi:uncharacterized protein (TIGR02646 family)